MRAWRRASSRADAESRAAAARRAGSAGAGKPGRQRSRRAGLCVLWQTRVEIPHDVFHARERAVVEEEADVLELSQRQHAELEGVAVTSRDFPASVIAKVRILVRHGIQGLERVVGEPEVVEVLFHELPHAGHVGVGHLLIEHRAAVAAVAPGAAVFRGREEEAGEYRQLPARHDAGSDASLCRQAAGNLAAGAAEHFREIGHYIK